MSRRRHWGNESIFTTVGRGVQNDLPETGLIIPNNFNSGKYRSRITFGLLCGITSVWSFSMRNKNLAVH